MASDLENVKKRCPGVVFFLLIMVLLSMFLTTKVSYAADAWDGTTITPVTPAGPDEQGGYYYYLTNGAELAWIAQQVNSGSNDFKDCFVHLTKDIDLGEQEWTPIGTGSVEYEFEESRDIAGEGTVDYYKPVVTSVKAFSGTFSGNGHLIKGLKIDAPSAEAPQGLFGVLGSNATISTFKVEGSVSGKCFVGSAVGFCGIGIKRETGIIYNIASSVTVRGQHYVGGIVGYSNAQVTNTKVNGSVTGSRYVGGICGYIKNAEIGNSVTASEVSGIVASEDISNPLKRIFLDGSAVGGIAGQVDGGNVSACAFEGSVTGNDSCGGIIGIARTVSTSVAGGITGCISNGPVTGIVAGALVGEAVDYNDVSNHNPFIFKDCTWNSLINSSSVGNVSYLENISGSSFANINSFTDIGTQSPSTVLLSNLGVVNMVFNKTYDLSVSFYPTGSNTTLPEIKWFLDPENHYYIANIIGKDSNSTIKVALDESAIPNCLSVMKVKIKHMLVNKVYENGVPKDNYYLLETYLLACNYAEPIEAPIVPSDSDVIPKVAVILTETGRLPDDVKSLVEIQDGKVLPFIDVLKEKIGNDSEYRILIDTETEMSPIPVFTSDIEAGKTVLATFKATLNEFIEKQFGQICMLKILEDGSLARFTVNQNLMTIQWGEFCISNLDGTQVDPYLKPEQGKEYLISLAIKDGSDFDISKGLGDLLDPAFLASTKAVYTPGGGGGGGGEVSGGGGGCNAGFGILALFALLPLGYYRYRRKN